MATRTMSSTAVAILALLAGAQAAGIHQGGEVLELNAQNFDGVVSSYSYVLVLFYSPWCGYCKQLFPEYDAAAKILAEKPIGSYTKMAKIDNTVHNALGSKYKISAYPTLKLFYNGQESAKYSGARNANAIVNWLAGKSTISSPQKGNCTENYILCGDGEKCIHRGDICDGHPDCGDESDELPSICRFTCADGVGITRAHYKCDGDRDCNDGSDEENCGNCTSSEFACADGKQCIPGIFKCDGNNMGNCRDKSDESPSLCGCDSSEFMCADASKCILISRKCDGENDCDDGSDEIEENCGNCTAEHFACADGRQCVPASYKCDGGPGADCRDESDEDPRLCGCRPDQFKCTDFSKCVDFPRKCDGSPDCDDGTDEWAIHCGNCTSEMFACADGNQCISQYDTCDYEPNCRDASDETDSLCLKNCTSDQFACADGRKCIPAHFVCDGGSDCRDGSDEEGRCRFECADGSKSVRKSYLCDGDMDCPDGSDEIKETCGNCTSDEFLCANGIQCIPASQMCDGRSTCRDGSDEHTTVCGDCTSSQFACADGLQCIKAAYECDGGTPDCEDGSDESYEACKVNCTSSEFPCANGRECIPANNTCNGITECRDGSDEAANICGCKADQFKCGDGLKCIREDYICDGDRDCNDGSDEDVCELDEHGCTSKQFACSDGSKCVRPSYKCDGDNDCADGSDESASLCGTSVSGGSGSGGCMTTPSRPDRNGSPSKGNTKCIFPFTFAGITYDDCAPGRMAINLPEDSLWCSTKVDSYGEHVGGQGEWGYCTQSCSGWSTERNLEESEESTEINEPERLDE